MGQQVGHYVLQHKDIIGLFDSFCMGMINGVFPQKALVDIGYAAGKPVAVGLLVEMAKVPPALREECLAWYEARGMTFSLAATRPPSSPVTRCWSNAP
jgi:hypothetical protein